MKIQINEEGCVTGYALVGDLSGCTDYNGELPEGFEEEFSHYRLENGNLIKLSDYISEIDRQRIRSRREKECFKVVDRPLWLQMLGPARLTELTVWYKAWLDAPRTGIIPEKPQWLEGGEK